MQNKAFPKNSNCSQNQQKCPKP